MEGKADMLLANRTLSALIVVCLLFSGFAGLMFLADAPVAKAQSGDLIVTGTYTIQDTVQPVDGNVVVDIGGNLIIRNATLSVISNQNPVSERHSITVSTGGTLTLDHGTITTYLDQIDPWPYLTLNVNGGTLTASASSVLQFPGSIVLTANAQVTLDETTVMALPIDEVNKYVVGGAIAIADQADDGPSITMTDSTLKLIDSSIPNLPEYKDYAQPASNITLNGNSNLLGVNSYISIDFGPVTGSTSWYTHNVLDLKGLSKAYLYGCWLDTRYVGEFADRAPAIVTYLTANAAAIPSTKGAGDNTGDNIADLAATGDGTYDVAVGQTMEIDTWSLSYADAQPIAHPVLSMTYTASPTYTGTVAVQWAAQGSSYAATSIVPVPPGTTSTYTLPMTSILTAGDLRNMNLRFSPVGGSGSVQIDQARITFDVGSDAFIYRWLNASVGDEYGVPIVGASISAKHTGSTSLEGRDAFYYTTAGVSATPPAEVLTWLGKTVGTYLTTDSDGVAKIPFMTDMIVNGMSTSALFVGSYALTGSAVIGGGPHSSTSPFAFIAYPAMEQGNQSADHTVKILGVSAESPNPSRWLVVPVNATTPNLAIEDMTYYHAGDVIVAAGGTLWMNNSEFQLVQAYPNQRQIYVDGTLTSMAKLILNGASVMSEMPIDIVVQGNGVLMATDSVLQGVNIVALEDAQVVFHNVTMDGTISTSFDSRAVLSIYDSDLTQPVLISGQATGGFTNTSVPSVVVEDDAIAYIYRWIHVTVYDGNGFPLPGATVTARNFVNGTPAASGVSDSTGVARVSSTGTKITATGSTFVGNYRVNTTLSHAGNSYYGDEFSVGVMPYTEPLGRNATFATVTLPGALPDLVLNVGALAASPVSPMNHEWTYLNLTVSNTGAAPAHFVVADFYDTPTDLPKTKIGSGQVDFVPVDGTAIMTFLWQAHEPLSPGTHTITAELDPENVVDELDESPQSATVVITVQNMPDLEVRPDPSEIWAVPSSVVQFTEVELRANVHNVGDATVIGVRVQFFDGLIANLIGETFTDSISKDGLDVVSVLWTPTTFGDHAIIVRVNNGSAGPHDFVEISYSNNEAIRTFNVLTPPNLVMTNLEFSPAGSVPGGDFLTISATLTNTESAPVTLIPVSLYREDYPGVALMNVTLSVTLIRSSTIVSMMYRTAPVTASTDVTFRLEANPAHSINELTYDDNWALGTISVLDMRPNLFIAPSRISFINPSTHLDATNMTYGRTVNVVAMIENMGGKPADNFTVTIGYRNDTYSSNGTFVLTPSNYSVGIGFDKTVNVTFPWKIMLTNWGWYEIWVWVDSNEQIDEQQEGDNFAVGLLEVNPLQVDIVINPDKNEYSAGDLISITATVYYKGTFDLVPSAPQVTFMLEDSNNNPVEDSETEPPVDGTPEGVVSQSLLIPTNLRSGSYEVVATVLGQPVSSLGAATVQVTALGGGGLFPMWVWYVIIIVVVAAVAGFTLYTYKYGLGKYVECGECGAFIPAASKRCPKCGVEFEAGTMKCSECGAWIPAESTECPNCGVKFVGELEEEGDYLERMRKEYDEMVSKYRELAKPELGKKFSDKAFDEWWRKQAGYITFDDWLAKEEEKKKEGPIPCPVCGTLNPKEATVCHKCGTVFGAVKAGIPPKAPPPAAPPAAGAPPAETYEAAAPGAAPRMVIRRPIEKKVVPKKIIRTPSGQVIEEEPKEGENNQ